MNLTIDMLLSLKKHGFAFEQFEHDCNPGMTYYYNNCEYIIGGKCDESPCSSEDQFIAQNGLWLPDESHLMLWLQWEQNYNVTIQYNASERYFYGIVEDDNTVIEGSGPDLLCCLYKLVLKVCKQK